MIQLELIGETVQNHISEDEGGDAILPAFEGLQERLVQYNANIASDVTLKLVVQVVHNPRGGVKHKLEQTLDCDNTSQKTASFLLQNNYGIKISKPFSGFCMCHYCYKSYTKPYAHQCKGYCSVTTLAALSRS